jgi:signal peptidase II
MVKWLWLSALVIALDQGTKYLASQLLALYQSVEFIPLLKFTLLHNKGAAFSFLSSAGGWQRWVFTILSLVVSFIIVAWLRRLSPREKWQAAGLALILGGALGNVIDRILHGYVVDFLDFYYPAEQCLPLFYQLHTSVAECHWPAFNVADSAITVGVVLLLVDSLRSSIKRHTVSTNKDSQESQ